MLHCNFSYIYLIIVLNTYQVKLAIFVIFVVSYKCTNANVFISTRAVKMAAGNGHQRAFWTFLERGNVLK